MNQSGKLSLIEGTNTIRSLSNLAIETCRTNGLIHPHKYFDIIVWPEVCRSLRQLELFTNYHNKYALNIILRLV